MSKERKPALLHPFLFAVFPILFLYSRNMGEFPLSVILVPALESLLFTAVGLTVVRLVTGCWRKAGLLASSFLIIFYSYGHLRIALYALPVDLDVLPLKAHTILCFS
jgi:hypothetical protein